MTMAPEHTRKAILFSSLALLSGLASGYSAVVGIPSSSRIGEFLVLYLPGALFALMVLLPLLAGLRFKLVRGLLLTCLSVATYYAAVRASVAVHGNAGFLLLIACVGAAAASVMSLLPAWILKTHIRVYPTALAVSLGGLGGLAIGWPLSTNLSLPDAVENLVIVFGFVIWQCAVALTLGYEKLRAGT